MQFGYAIIYVPDVAEAADFYERAFGIATTLVHESGDFAQMATGETALAFTSHRLGATAVPIPYRSLDRRDQPPGFEFTLITPDVTDAYDQAVTAGAEGIAEPHDTPWGQTVSYVRDPYGVLIGIASPMA
jgi:lactoylglutathione lyase